MRSMHAKSSLWGSSSRPAGVSPARRAGCRALLRLVARASPAARERRPGQDAAAAFVVALGFGMNLFADHQGRQLGFLYTAISILASVSLGLLLGRFLRVKHHASLLITVGTAICGGSAIAAVALSWTRPKRTSASPWEPSSCSTRSRFSSSGRRQRAPSQPGSVRPLGCTGHPRHQLGSRGQRQYGSQALMIGTTVEAGPGALDHPRFSRRGGLVSPAHPPGRPQLWFLQHQVALVHPVFLSRQRLAHLSAGLIPWFDTLSHLGKTGLTATLFLIGSGLSGAHFSRSGYRPMLQGVMLWIVVATLSVVAIYEHVISI